MSDFYVHSESLPDAYAIVAVDHGSGSGYTYDLMYMDMVIESGFLSAQHAADVAWAHMEGYRL